VPIFGTTKHLETDYRARRNTLYALTWLTLTMSGCTNAPIARMNSNFNAQPIGVPQQFPAPSPPNDQFIWLSQQPVSSVVAANPSGGNWVLTVAKPAFLVDPDVRHQFLLASSEPFTTSPPTQMNGQFSVRLVGTGKVDFGIRATRGSAAGFVGAGEVSTGITGAGGVGIVLTPGVIDNLAAFSTRDFPVIGIATYNPGQVLQVFYSIDQASRTINFAVGGGASGSRSTNYGFSGPIAQLELWLFLRQPTSSTKVFVNEVKMNELR
jgi:hypothetical protein